MDDEALKDVDPCVQADAEIIMLSQGVRMEKDPERRLQMRIHLSRAFNRIGQDSRALYQLRLAERDNPTDPVLLSALGAAILREGQVAEGLSLYDKGRWQRESFEKFNRTYPFPHWNGEDLKGKNLLVWAEQGVGDQIMHGRALARLQETGATISVECDPRLIPLYKRANPNLSYFIQQKKLDARLLKRKFDFQTSMFSAWRWIDDPLRPAPSIVSDANMESLFRKAWKQQDRSGKPQINIGLSWHSKAPHNGHRRTIPLNNFWPLADMGRNHLRFHNVQYGQTDAAALSKLLTAPLMIDRDTDPLKDLDRAAAQLSALDLVITIDNTTAHMAGALNVPTWLILPKGADFRWGKDSSETPLYPSLKMYRSPDANHWGIPLMMIANDIEKWIKTGKRPHQSDKNNNKQKT